jgi:hypothetical protein
MGRFTVNTGQIDKRTTLSATDPKNMRPHPDWPWLASTIKSAASSSANCTIASATLIRMSPMI